MVAWKFIRNIKKNYYIWWIFLGITSQLNGIKCVNSDCFLCGGSLIFFQNSHFHLFLFSVVNLLILVIFGAYISWRIINGKMVTCWRMNQTLWVRNASKIWNIFILAFPVLPLLLLLLLLLVMMVVRILCCWTLFMTPSMTLWRDQFRIFIYFFYDTILTQITKFNMNFNQLLLIKLKNFKHWNWWISENEIS